MLTLKLALRNIGRRKGRMILIGSLVALGTFLIVFGTIFASSAKSSSKASIIDNFTGDFIVYSSRSKDLPSPFAFNTPLPRIRNLAEVTTAIADNPEVESYAPFAQNYGLIQVERDGKRIDLPFIFYAVEPEGYLGVFRQVTEGGSPFFGLKNGGTAGSLESGIMVSEYQNAQYQKNYGLSLKPGEKVTLLGITEGGVNTVTSTMVGSFTPGHYTSVFNYINYMDADTYSRVYDYAGVEALPDSFNQGLDQAGSDEEAIFGLAANPGFGTLDLATLKSESLSGATMIAVRLKDHGAADRIMTSLSSKPELGIKVAPWAAASGFYAQIAAGLQAFIYLATALVFLVVALIFMNTLIINVTERTGEIGTMRAIGGDRSFIRGIFIAEALLLNVTSALVGMAAAGVAVLALAGRGLSLPELVSQFLIGGGSLMLTVTAFPFILALVVVVLVSILATAYPVRVATAITPLRAMNER